MAPKKNSPTGGASESLEDTLETLTNDCQENKTRLDEVEKRLQRIDEERLQQIDGRLNTMDDKIHEIREILLRLDKLQSPIVVEPPKTSFLFTSSETKVPVKSLEDDDEEAHTNTLPSQSAVVSAVVVGKIQKIPSEVLLPFNPDEGATAAYCDNLRRLASMYGELSVIAAIPQTLQGRAKDWFNANTMSIDQMRTVQGWITAHFPAAFLAKPHS
jgi:hypothetical protein